MSRASFDVAVAGGGLVGLATALALLEQRERDVSLVLLEAEPELAAHQSSHNSGVIHAGLYYRPGTLKAQTCRDGRAAMYRFCAEHGVPHKRVGKLVVAVSPDELPRLAELETRGRANGVDGLRRVEAEELREIEPHATGVAALWVPETGVVAFADVAAAIAREVRARGGEIRTSSRVLATRADGAGSELVITTTGGDVRAALLVNCAGLQADRLARACGVDPGVLIVPFRGEYYELVPDRRDLVRHLIYPVPDPRLPFLGVYFTRTIDDRVEAGPNAVLALKREGYRGWDVSPRDIAETLSFGGFWRMAARFARTGVAELARSLSKRAFVSALQRLVPSLRAEDVVPGGSGVRAQAIDRSGRLLDDFCIVEGRRSIHVVNAPSPAATASLAIGRHLAARAFERLRG